MMVFITKQFKIKDRIKNFIVQIDSTMINRFENVLLINFYKCE